MSERTKVKSIQELLERMEKEESERLVAGEEINCAWAALVSALGDINICCSSRTHEFITCRYEHCIGFLKGLLAAHYISSGESDMLSSEVSAAFRAYRERAFAGVEKKPLADTHCISDGEGAPS